MKKIVLAITGASGALYAKQFIDFVRPLTEVQLDVVASANGMRIFHDELSLDLGEYWPRVCANTNFDVPFVSGSACADVMVILPCSMGTLGRIAGGFSNDVITRTADVMLKERKKLILVPREMPFNQIHLKNMLTLDQAGAVILPAMPSFYSCPQTIEALSQTVVTRVLDHAGIPNELMKRWG
ncbi:MAG: 3-polyprenyl-4-hydroxybenzoate decarboxylase [uncultured bacterium]|nr:MAG: 3-polyprenyl-4-hydroxybenzoate decarboxylase [uncultured bacterium]HLD45360.1 UbiX family flavin prenyltransferase [bacterium]